MAIDLTDLTPLPWQHALLRDALAQFRQQRLGHALLLSGSAGVGKRRWLWSFVAAALCERESEAACGQCSSCLKLLVEAHPDVLHLHRESDEKTGKLRRDIRIDQVRGLIERLALASHFGRGRFAILDPADALNAAGQNALLKTLEEPPAGTYLLLVTERLSALPATIRSRCQVRRIAAPPPEALTDWLAQEGLDEAALSLAGGAPLLARDWQERQQLAVFQRWESLWQGVAQGRTTPLAMAAEIGKEEAATFIDWLQRWSLRTFRSALLADDAIQIAAMQELYPEVVSAPAALAGNATPQLLIESLVIGWWRAVHRARRDVQSSSTPATRTRS